MLFPSPGQEAGRKNRAPQRFVHRHRDPDSGKAQPEMDAQQPGTRHRDQPAGDDSGTDRQPYIPRCHKAAHHHDIHRASDFQKKLNGENRFSQPPNRLILGEQAEDKIAVQPQQRGDREGNRQRDADCGPDTPADAVDPLLPHQIADHNLGCL